MRELAGKAAFVTGAASGIGLAMATAFARDGMKVMLADIETGPLDKAVDALRAGGADVHGVVCDVADPLSVDRAAEASFRAFGKVHVVCNNAGVAAGDGIDPISVGYWPVSIPSGLLWNFEWPSLPLTPTQPMVSRCSR
ncbi:NAD(P)-dependent dehydrogenase (short-subunit alcohol dehydrogenase family) [Bradyrhizobium sp. USDA 4518]